MITSNRSTNRLAGLLGLLLVAAAGAALAGPPDAADLVPGVRVGFPLLGGTSARTVPTTFTATVEAVDADDPAGLPWKWRCLWVPALTPQGDPIQVRSLYEQYVDELIRWDDPGWSDWAEFPAGGEAPSLSFPDLENGTVWLLALQVMDRDGAVSTGRGYQVEVANVKVSELAYYPDLTLAEMYLGVAPNWTPSSQVAAGQPLNFHWIADASSYNGTIVSYRHGWDLIDPDDPMDPGWEVPPGTAPENLYSQERTFSSGGLHFFYVQVTDDCGKTVRARWELDVVPHVSYAFQRPLLVIDQVVDDNTGMWPDAQGNPRDLEDYRNAYWQFLDGPDGVQDFDWEADRFDHAEPVEYSDIVGYRAVLCYARLHTGQTMMSEFRAVNNVDRFVWLTPYQARGGNFFLVGDSSMDSFIEMKNNYYVPMVFDCVEEPLNGYETSFGWTELADGSVVPRGPRQYPYATAGIAALDWSATPSKTIYGSNTKVYNERTPQCAGVKGLVLDAGFQVNHLIGPGALPDTIFTETAIDWMDQADLAAGTLELLSDSFPFRNDEFVDANISPRTTPIVPQSCAAGPGGRCIEPMFTGIARFDWLREIEHAQGDVGWPASEYTTADLDELCGAMALDRYDGDPATVALTNGHAYGYLSYRMVDDKPSGKADAYWGFDPYRFDHQDTQRAIRWVLDYFGLELN